MHFMALEIKKQAPTFQVPNNLDRSMITTPLPMA